MEINNYPPPVPTSSPIGEGGLPSPNLTEPICSSSPKKASGNLLLSDNSKSSGNKSTSNSKINKSKEFNITEYCNKELKSMKKRCRTVMTPSQYRILHKVLEHTAFPSTEIRENLAKILGMKPRTVQIWFQNQRQKSRQSRESVSSDDSSISSPESGTDLEMTGSNNTSSTSLNSTISTSTNSSPPNSYEFALSPSPSASLTPSPNSSTSPNFSALTAAAFALSNNPLPPLDQQSNCYPINPQQQQHQQPQQQPLYSTFHGAVFKSTPGALLSAPPSMNSYRGNTASAINAKRIAATLRAGGSQVIPHFLPGSAQQNPLFLPSQPQRIPLDTANGSIPMNNSSLLDPLDVLASAVSNFRPNGYNYYGVRVSNNNNNNNTNIGPSTINNTTTTTSGAPSINRLPPIIRTPSPPGMNAISPPISSPSTKLPSLKALAQVASISDEDLEKMHKRSKSLALDGDIDKVGLYQSPPRRRYSSSVAERSTNASAPNSHAAIRRPW